MKKSFLLFSCMLICVVGFSQHFHLELFSGYNIPNYDQPDYEIEDYSESAAIPMGVRIAGGHEYVQLGVEYRQNLTNSTFTFDQLPGISTTLDETFYGAFLRVNISSIPIYRAGIVLKGGAGYYNYKQTINGLTDINGANTTIEHTFDKKLGYHGGIGLSGPIYMNLHLELGYSYHFVDRDPLELSGLGAFPGANGYKAGYHSITAGLSINLMVTEKARAGCKNRRHKSKGKHGRGGWYSK